MRPVDVAPLLEHRQDLRLLRRCETVRGAPPRTRISQILACGSTARPAAMPPRPPAAGTPHAPLRRPSLLGRVGDQAEQAPLRGTADARGDRAAQPQRSFPSNRVTFTAISASAARQRSAAAFAAASSTSRPALRRPGLDAANASNAPRRATSRSLATVERSNPRPVGCLPYSGLAAHELQPDLVLLRRRQQTLLLPRSLSLHNSSIQSIGHPQHAGRKNPPKADTKPTATHTAARATSRVRRERFVAGDAPASAVVQWPMLWASTAHASHAQFAP